MIHSRFHIIAKEHHHYVVQNYDILQFPTITISRYFGEKNGHYVVEKRDLRIIKLENKQLYPLFVLHFLYITD